MTERLVDLSLKPEFLDRHREECSNSQTGKKVLKLILRTFFKMSLLLIIHLYLLFWFVHLDEYELNGWIIVINHAMVVCSVASLCCKGFSVLMQPYKVLKKQNSSSSPMFHAY